jgi:predicted N-acyltransferase
MNIGYKVKVFDTVDDIGKDAIDAISDDPFFTYGWFKTLEQQVYFDFNPRYLAVYKKSELVALAPCFLDSLGHYFSFGPSVLPFMNELLSTGNGLGLWQKRILVCYSPFCYRSKVLLSENCGKQVVLNLLLEKIDYVCKREQILFSSFLFTSEFNSLLINSLPIFGYFRFAWKQTYYLDVPWLTFEEYLLSLKRKRRKSVRRDIRKCRENDIVFNAEPNFEEISARLSFLHSNLFRKHNNGRLSPFHPSFFEDLNFFAKENAIVFVARKNGEVIGFSLGLRKNGFFDSFMVGFDYKSEGVEYVYFNLAFYEIIKWAISNRATKIYFRFTADRAKTRRGCKKEQVFSFVKCHSKLLNLFVNPYIRLKYRTVRK